MKASPHLLFPLAGIGSIRRHTMPHLCLDLYTRDQKNPPAFFPRVMESLTTIGVGGEERKGRETFLSADETYCCAPAQREREKRDPSSFFSSSFIGIQCKRTRWGEKKGARVYVMSASISPILYVPISTAYRSEPDQSKREKRDSHARGN